MNGFPRPPEYNLTPRPNHIVITVLTVGLSTACADRAPEIQQGAINESVFAVIASADYESVRQAFDDLNGRNYSVEVETQEWDESGTLVAKFVERLDVGGSGIRSRTTETATDEPFSDGFLSFLSNPDSAIALRYAPLLPDRPAFAHLRTREQFRYSSPGDTIIFGTAARMYEAQAVSASDKQPIRLARMGVSKVDTTILFVRLQRHDDTIFYEEESIAELTLARDSAGVLLPAKKYVEVTIDVPFEPARKFAVIESYSYEAGVESGASLP